MADKSMNKISLKALVHSKRVIFVESDNDFVDVLCSFLTIPMGTIIRLARSRSLPVGIGCMNYLYESAESMDSKVFRAEKCQDMLLFPRNRGSSLMGKLKLNIDDSDHKMYRCSRFDRCPSGYRFSYYKTVCSCGSPMDSEINFMDNGSQDDGVYVNGESKLIVSDDLQVMPPLTSASSSLFSKLGVKDSNTIREATFNVRVAEVFDLLICSFVSKTPLTDILLKNKSLLYLTNLVRDQKINVNSRLVGYTWNKDETNISLKLIVSKSKGVVCYAEAGEDFVNLLFSFLIVPLGFILKEMHAGSSKGCIDQLYKSIQNLDEQYLKSDYYNKMLLDPEVAPGFCYESHPLGIREATFHCLLDIFGDISSGSALVDGAKVKAEFVDPKSLNDADGSARGFLKRRAMFTVEDSLIVRPVSPILGVSVLNQLSVPLNDIEVQVVNVGKQEAFRLLVASFVTDSALTSVFLR